MKRLLILFLLLTGLVLFSAACNGGGTSGGEDGDGNGNGNGNGTGSSNWDEMIWDLDHWA